METVISYHNKRKVVITVKLVVTKEEGGTFGILLKRTRPGEVQLKRRTGIARTDAKKVIAELVDAAVFARQSRFPAGSLLST